VAPVVGQHWLVTARAGIDDSEPPVTERDVPFRTKPMTATVRAAMGYLVGQMLYFAWHYGLAAEINDAGNSTHD
jgi:hypothetical protein